MSNGIWIAASGAAGQMSALDVAANNAANSSTPSYKEERILFQQHLVEANKAGNARTAMRYNGVREIGGNYLDGSLKVTERGLDVAIRGEGFFAVQTANGERYTRAGSFQIAQDGTLLTGDGSPALNTASRPIKVTAGPQSVRISDGGAVEVNGEPVGQLRMVRFPNQVGLEREGHYLFRASEASGRPAVAPVQLDPGSVEMSNVSIVKGMADIVSATRSFDALEKMIDAFREAERQAATDLMRVR